MIKPSEVTDSMVVEFQHEYEREWDEFVLKQSINGNFLQTRNFYNYHKQGKFKDASILFMKEGKIAAVLPANETNEGKTLLAHQGSTFGGIIIGRNYANTLNYKWIFREMIEYFHKKKYESVELRMHHWLYSPDERKNELLDYFFQLNGFLCRCEVGFYIDLNTIGENFTEKFEKLKKRKLNKAQKNGLEFKKIDTDMELLGFYNTLADNMKKFNTLPVHTYEELLDFKNKRLKETVSFYGVYVKGDIIAGSMVFDFCEKKVFHTQYLASKHDYLEQCPNEFLYANLIRTAKQEGYQYISFGTSTLEHGNVYNESLGMYKEGFNTDSYINRTYIWKGDKNA